MDSKLRKMGILASMAVILLVVLAVMRSWRRRKITATACHWWRLPWKRICVSRSWTMKVYR